MVFSHAFAGATLTRLLHKSSKLKLSEKQINILYFVGIFSAILPDLDIALIFRNNTVEHRALITHSALPYLFIAAVLWLVFKLRSKPFLQLLTLAFVINTVVSHLFLDMFAGGLVLFAPFSYQTVGFALNFPTDPVIWAKTYLTSKYMLMEAFLTVLYLLTIKSYKNKVLTYFPLFIFVASVVTFAIMTLIIL